MKNTIHTLKTTALSIMAVASVTAVATLTTSVAHADTWKTLPPSVCQAEYPGNVVNGQLRYYSEYVRHYDVAGGPAQTIVYCPLKMDDNAPATLAVYVDYSKSDSMGCQLVANHYYGLPKTLKTFSVPTGVNKFTYNTIGTGSWWSSQVLCWLGHNDKLHALNYKAL